MFDDFMTKLARRVGENVGKSKIELVKAQVESEVKLQELEESTDKDKPEREQEKREKLEKIAKNMGIEDIEGKTDDELIHEIADNLPDQKS
ncbi:MAG: hypothetical protein R6U44_04980 [Archaeoglobaceae archaeon]